MKLKQRRKLGEYYGVSICFRVSSVFRGKETILLETESRLNAYMFPREEGTSLKIEQSINGKPFQQIAYISDAIVRLDAKENQKHEHHLLNWRDLR